MAALLKATEVKDLLQVGLATVYQLVDQGALPAVVLKTGKRKRLLRFRLEDVEQFIAQHATPVPAGRAKLRRIK